MLGETRQAVGSLIPDARVRKLYLTVFLESVLEADTCGKQKWGVYHIQDRVRLLVGGLIVQTLHRQGIWLTLDQEILETSPEESEPLKESPDWRWDSGPYSKYVKVASQNGFYAPSKDLELWPTLKNMHFSFINKVADRFEALRAPSQARHMPALLLYLRQELDCYVPEPVYHEDTFVLPEEIAEGATLCEGSRREITVNAYERNPDARRECIRHYGTSCVVCGFNFEEAYGEVGRGFIHVHHLQPLANIGEEYEVNPKDDLRPVCPNCHAIIHRSRDPYSIDQVKQFLRKSSG